MKFTLGEIWICADGTILHPVESLNFPVREEVLTPAEMRIVNLRASIPDTLPLKFCGGFVFWEDGQCMSVADYEQVRQDVGGR